MEKASAILSQILFGGRLEDKLAGSRLPLSEIEWDQCAMVLPENPGRDGALRPVIDKKGAKNNIPKRSELQNESNRGKLLHFFANHELLAIETMAYTLLKFQDAPLEFKKGVMKTIQDEQRHMGLYLDRMHDYGVDLGGVSLNLYFWNILKTMQSPIDFVARMSLTFEQANLDFALEYSKIFEEEIADEKTAKLLRVIHDDEVKHVAHGLRWFNEWRNQSETEFQSYQKLLPFPLSPRRGKGAGGFFSAESRKDAGFSDDFILSMKVAGGSRGKVPDYLFYNPHCEIESQVKLSAALKSKIADLAPLMVWLAQEDDVVELLRKPDLDWLNAVYDLRGELPDIVLGELGSSLPAEAQKYVVFEEMKPWGWGPSAWKRLSEIESKVRQKPRMTEADVVEHLFSKTWWKTHLKNLGLDVFGHVIDSSDSLDAWITNEKLSDPHARYLLKSAASTSGRGHLEFSRDMLDDEALVQKLKKRLEAERSFVIEPLLKKQIDFSTQYEIFSNGEVRAEEPRFFLNDSRYQYLGSFLGNWGVGTRFEREYKLIRSQMGFLREQHEHVVKEMKAHGFVGSFGIDSLIYVDEEADSGSAENLKIAPIIEVNARNTMGRVAHQIERAILKKTGQKHGFWFFVNRNDFTPDYFSSEFKHEWIATTPYSQTQSTWTVAVWGHQILTEGFLDRFLKRC
jgi:uncharacterized ferritin-like protein (DUF455 family)